MLDVTTKRRAVYAGRLDAPNYGGIMEYKVLGSVADKDIFLENMRICRLIIELKQDDCLIEQCRAAIRENIKLYDRLQFEKIEKKKEEKKKKKEEY